MTRGEPELWSQLAQADAMDHGETQQALMEDVVRHADAAGFHRLAFAARRALASAYSVDRQWHKAFPLFARCLSDYDARPWQWPGSTRRRRARTGGPAGRSAMACTATSTAACSWSSAR
jgi:hypothetical protein